MLNFVMPQFLVVLQLGSATNSPNPCQSSLLPWDPSASIGSQAVPGHPQVPVRVHGQTLG